MLERLRRYLGPPIFPDDEDKTFTASLVYVILWSLLLGIGLYVLVASVFALILPQMLLIAWLYVLATGVLTMTIMYVMWCGHVRAAAVSVNVGLWIILTVAAYFNGGVVAPAYSGYLIVIISASLLVGWHWGVATAVASALVGFAFLLAGNSLPNWRSTSGAVWGANVAYFFVTTTLLALALRAITRASQQIRYEMAERLKTEQALRHSEQRFHAIFDSVNDAILVQDLGDGRILDVNKTMCEMYGYTMEEARQLRLGDLSATDLPFTRQEALDWWQKAARGEPQILEWRAKDRAGRLFWVEINLRRVTIDGQDRLLVVVRDIDDRKRTEAALHREQAYYEAIVNATPVMLWLKDTENRVLHLNPAAATLEGLEAPQAEGKSAYDLYPREQAEADYRDDLAVIQSGQPKLGIVEQHAAAGTGKVMWLETGKVPVRDDQGNIIGVLACAIDITERKEAEQVQVATRQIAEAALMTQNLEEFYQSVHAIISPLIPARNFYIALYDAAHDLLNVPCLFDEFDKVWPPYHPGNGLSAYVMRTGEPLLATSAVFAELAQQGEAEIIHRPMVEWLGVPLKTTQGTLGVMAVQNYSGPARLHEKHKDLLMFVSVQVAMAIERKRAEQRLQLKEESLRLALEAARMGTWDWQAESDQWTWSDNVEDMFQLKTGEPAGTFATYLSQVLPEDRQRAADTLANVFAGREDRFLVEHRVRWADDSIHWLEGRGQVFRDAHGQPVRLAGIIADITDRKRMEAELAHERDLLQSLMDNFPDTIYFKDTASRFTRVNRAQAKLLGLAAPEAAIGKTDADFFQHDGLFQQFLAEEQRLMTDGEPIVNRVEYNPTADGQPRWLSASKVPLRDGTGQIVGMVGISRDITDRMLAEQREKTFSRGLRAVIEAAQELIDCVDLDTLYRRSVELAREKLGLERCALYLLDDRERFIQGTFGTDDQGRTTDERTSRHPVQEHPEVFHLSERIWLSYERAYTYWEVDHGRLLGGIGWNVATPIRSRWRTVGVLYNDAAITRASLDETQQDIVAVYCSILGSLLELKRTEAALAHERDLLQALMDNIPDLIYFKDAASRFTRINRAQARFLGLATPEEALGKTDLDLQDRPLAQSFWAEEQELIRTGQPIVDRVEYNPTHDGQPRWLTATKVPLRDAAGQVYGIAGVSRDVTDRTLAQRRDRVISEGLRAVIEAADELISCADPDTLYRRAVELAREKLKVERCGLFVLDEQGWLCGTYGTDMQRQTSDERSARFQPINLVGLDAVSGQRWAVAESEHAYWEGDQQHIVGAGWVGTTFIRTRDRVLGVLYNDTAITHAPADDAQQEVLAVYGSLLGSLIELKYAEEALRESESTMRALLEAIPDAIFRFDVQGVFKDFIPAKNFAPLASPESFIGKPYAEVLPPEMVQQLDENFQIVSEKGELRLYEYALPVDGQAHYYESRLVKMAQGDVLGIVRDVTDRKQAELALQRREAYLRAILDNFPYWFWLKDTAGHYLAANRTLAEALGFSQVEELIGKTDWDVTPTVAAKFRADDQEVIDNRSQKFVEEIVIDRGEENWFETFKSPIFDARDRVIGTAGFSHDITARRQAEAAMRESEALFRNLADNAPAFIAMSDETGQATYLNRAWREFRGTLPALPFDEWVEHIHPDDRRRYAHEFRSALQAQRKFTTEYRLRRADGQYRWLLDTIVPRYTADERFAGFIGIAIDMTDRKNAEEALRRSEGRLRLLADNMVDSISQIDAQHRLIYASPSIERVFGHSLRDLLGHPLYERVHSEDAARLYHQVLMAIELHAPSLRLEYRYRHAAGHYVWVESEMRLLYDEHGSFTGAVFGSRDVSTRKQVEAEREELIKELEDKNAELERFTYTVSHDLKSPLITIRGFLGFLEKDATTGDFDRLHADVTRITEATARMQRLLDELLELSRLGRMSNPPEEVPFGKIAREALELVQGRVMARGAQVEIADNLPSVYGDRTHLVEVVQNLIDNAVKFMGEQPEPRISIGALSSERAGMPIFFVQDNGAGIEPQYHERIFGLFNKLDAKSEGTGVGLALVKRIIELHGGHIWVESAGVGHGSTFFFTLPHPAPASGKS